MRSIVILVDQYRDPFAGTEGQVYKLAQGLSSKGWKLKLAVFRDSDYVRSGKFPVPIDVIGIDSVARAQSFLKLLRYARQLRSEGVQLVHIFFNDASVLGPPVFWAAGLRCVISRRDMGFWYTKLHRFLLPWTGIFVDSVICNSKAVARITNKVERFPDRKTEVIYNGYPELEEDVGGEPQRGNKDDNARRIIIGLVANIRPIKRIQDLIEASSELVSNHIPFEIHVVGGGDSSALKAKAAALGVSEQVVFWGSRDDVAERIKEFDVAVLCSESEGFSNSIIEYMRAGKPVVCTDTGGNPEIVEHGLTGYLYPVGDIAALGRHLLELAHAPEKRMELGRRALEWVRTHYTIEGMLDEHQALYDRIIKKSRERNA